MISLEPGECRMAILSAAAGLNNSQIAREVGLDVDTVRFWRNRWLGLSPGACPAASIGRPGESRRKVAGCAPSRGSRPDHPRASLPDHVPGL